MHARPRVHLKSPVAIADAGDRVRPAARSPTTDVLGELGLGLEGRRIGEPKEATKVEREIYELTRLPPPARYHHGAKGRGVEDPRRGLTQEWSVSVLPLIALDFCFLEASGTVYGKVADDGVSCLVLEDVDTWCLLAVRANAKTVTVYLVERSRRFVEHFFRRRVRLLCDGERASVALAGMLKELLPDLVVSERTSRHDGAERAIRTLDVRLKVMRLDFEQRVRTELLADFCWWPWLT